jgi:two-component system, LuxR family, sensor kinase FixL
LTVPLLIQRVTTAYLNANPRRILSLSAIMFGIIAFSDAAVSTVSLGVLYLLPIIVSSAFLPWSFVLIIAFASTALREVIGQLPFALDWETTARLARSFGGFALTGLLTSELARSRRLLDENVTALEREVALREEAQEQLSVLIDTSPAAILITDEKGRVLHANASAEDLLGFESGELIGQSIHPFLPAIETVPVGEQTRSLRSTLECRGQRRNGAIFIAQIWFSTFLTKSGPRVAAIVLDASQDLRERGGAGVALLMRTSRILIGAVSHSVRNLCAASKVSYMNLSRNPQLSENEDLKALGTLIRGLESISATHLERASERPGTSVDLPTLLDELRVVVEPTFEEAGIALSWSISADCPPVTGEHYALLHALLNITQNGERALRKSARKEFAIEMRASGDRVVLLFTDTAGGVHRPEELFQAFTPGATGSGLGLYVSRAVIRSFDGDLTYQPVAGGSCFQVVLRAAYNRANAARQS